MLRNREAGVLRAPPCGSAIANNDGRSGDEGCGRQEVSD